MWSIQLFWKRVLRSENYLDKDPLESTQNKKHTVNASRYDWSSFASSDKRNHDICKKQV